MFNIVFGLVVSAFSCACTVDFNHGSNAHDSPDAVFDSGPADGQVDGPVSDGPVSDRPAPDGPAQPECGNGIAEMGEVCDGNDLLGQTCADLGYIGGTLGCTENCTLDTSQCLQSGHCVGTCTPCENIADEQSCTTQLDCSWEQVAPCAGSCTLCEDLQNSSECSVVAGCNWDPAGPCVGTCTTCNSFDNETDCDGSNGQDGCSWRVGSCGGTADPCSAVPETSCATYGCTQTGFCSGGNQNCPNITNPNACQEAGCTWSTALSECGPALQTFNCLDITNAIYCNHETSDVCSWLTSCSGTPDPCAGRGELICNLGCSWTPAACVGTCIVCGNYTSKDECSDQAGCDWEPAGPCSGSCTPCGSLDNENQCQANGCTWQPTAPCTGQCTSCSQIQNEAACTEQAGCSWNQP